ncbi:MAG: HNH endonuclease [Vallitaleaceae bacterium]|nr:HNH endonuclease [Vallitaleaceae bacterium]
MQLDMNRQEAIWLERMLERSNMVTSYKAYWMIGVLEEIIEGHDVIDFDKVVSRMITNAWYPIIQYKLNFGFQDQLGKVIHYINDNYHFGAEIKKTNLLNLLCFSSELLGDTTLQNMKKAFYNMVPYRLLSPFFREKTKGLKDQKKNRLITQLSQDSQDCFYKIDEPNKMIIVDPHWMDYINENQAVIKGWLQNKLIIYLQVKNPSVPSIPFKLEPPSSRNLTKATNYWKRFNMVEPIKDIYTGKPLTSEYYKKLGAFSIDHFIPWSFVLHDELWNLMPTFKHINSSKSDKLPLLDKYLMEFCDLQYRAINYMKQSTSNQKILEDYLTIGGSDTTASIIKKGVQVDEEIFTESIKSNLVPIYQIAYNQGFEVWELEFLY